MPRIIPRTKIAHQRLGQLIYNVLAMRYLHREDLVTDEDILTGLFYIENDDLEKLIQKHIKENQ